MSRQKRAHVAAVGITVLLLAVLWLSGLSSSDLLKQKEPSA